MQIICLADDPAPAAFWVSELPCDVRLTQCALPRRRFDQDYFAPHDHGADTLADFKLGQAAELAVLSLRNACLGQWLAALHDCPDNCPKIAIANISAEYQKTLLAAGMDAILPLAMPGDVLAAQIVAFVRLQRKYHPVVSYGPVQFYNNHKRALVNKTDLRLTAREFDILHFIARANGRAVGPSELLHRIFGLTFDPGTNIAAVHIYRLRKKLADLGFAHVLQTVQGRGYRMAHIG